MISLYIQTSKVFPCIEERTLFNLGKLPTPIYLDMQAYLSQKVNMDRGSNSDNSLLPSISIGISPKDRIPNCFF